MTNRVFARVLSNASANVVAGATAVAFSMSISAIAARHLDHSDLARWSLVSSLGALAGVLALGMSTMVTRVAAELAAGSASSESDHQALSQVVMAARQLAFRICRAGGITALTLSMFLPLVFDSLALDQPVEFALAAWVQFMGALWLAASQPEQGALVAKQRNWTITSATAGARLCALAAAYAALTTLAEHRLLALSVAQALGMWFGWALLRLSAVPYVASSRPPSAALAATARRLRSLTLAMASWAVGMAVVQYGVTPYVSYLSPGMTVSAFAAITLGATLSGVFSAMLGGFLAPLTKVVAGGDVAKLGPMMRTVTTWCFVVVSVVYGTCLLGLERLLSIWLAGSIPSGSRALILWLLLQQYVRSVSAPAAVLLAISGSPRLVAIAPLFEAGGSLLVAVPIGAVYGVQAFAASLFFVASAAALLTWWLALNKPTFRLGGTRLRGLGVQLAATILSLLFVTLQQP